MRDREFAVAKKALAESTPDKTTIPESWELIGDGVLHGRRGKQHTVVIGVPVPTPKLGYGRIELRGDGKLLEPPKEFELHSWVRNFYNWMVCEGAATDANDGSFVDGQINVLDTGNNLRSYSRAVGLNQYNSPETGGYGYSSSVTVTTRGIVVGTNAGVSAEDEDDYALDTQIAHGVGGNQLYYATHQVPAVYTFDGSRVFTRNLTRYFDNFSGGAISIEEMGLICYIQFNITTYNVLVARDVIDTLAVPFRAQAAITYNFTITYPSSGSPLRNFYNMIVSQAMSISAKGPTFTDGLICGTDYGGTVRTHANQPFGFIANIDLHGAGYAAIGAAGSVVQGIVVGSDYTSPVSFDSYELGALIAHGTAAGQLQYSVSETPVRSWADPILTTSHARTFTNGSAATVTVRESGLIYETNISNAYFFLMFKDVFSDVDIAPAEDLRIVYQPQVTYP